jgi:hypothetical protein
MKIAQFKGNKVKYGTAEQTTEDHNAANELCLLGN